MTPETIAAIPWGSLQLTLLLCVFMICYVLHNNNDKD